MNYFIFKPKKVKTELKTKQVSKYLKHKNIYLNDYTYTYIYIYMI